MDEQGARWEISATLKQRGFRHIGPGPDQYRGTISVGHKRVEVDIEVPDLNFVTLPRIQFVDRSSLSLPLIAHLEQGTGLCYADQTLLRLDRYRPGASILRVLVEAESTIAKSMSGRASSEIAQEFLRYWGGDRVQVLIARGIRTANAHLALSADLAASQQTLLLPKDANIPKGFRAGRDVKIVFVNAALAPGSDKIYPTTLGELRQWHSTQATSDLDSFDAVLKVLVRQEIVFYAGSNGWVGCQLKFPADLKLLAAKPNLQSGFILNELIRREETVQLERYQGSEASLDHVTNRNLQEGFTSAKSKRIALIGCGTIGSHLARFLVQSGAGNQGELLLVDSQALISGNLGRHFLNFADIGKPKASALAEELRRFHPDVNVNYVNVDVSTIWKRIAGYDLVIDATGTETVSDSLNAKALLARKAGTPCNLLHVWLFGNGVASQSFLNMGGELACYRCLRPNLDAPWLNDPRKDVKDVGTVVPASCGDGPYLPYHVDAPVVAASLALRAALDFFKGDPGARLRNALIDSDRARHLPDKSPTRHERCPACK